MAKIGRPEFDKETEIASSGKQVDDKNAGEAENLVHGGFKFAPEAVDARSRVWRTVLRSTYAKLTERNQSLALIFNRQVRHNFHLFQQLAQPTNWDKVAQIQHAFLHTSWQRAAELGRRYAADSQTVMATHLNDRAVKEGDAPNDEEVEITHGRQDRRLTPERATTVLKGKTVEMLESGEELAVRNEEGVAGELALGKSVIEYEGTVVGAMCGSEVEDMKPVAGKPAGRASSRQELQQGSGHDRNAGFPGLDTMISIRPFFANPARRSPRWLWIGTVLGVVAAAIAVAALYTRSGLGTGGSSTRYT